VTELKQKHKLLQALQQVIIGRELNWLVEIRFNAGGMVLRHLLKKPRICQADQILGMLNGV